MRRYLAVVGLVAVLTACGGDKQSEVTDSAPTLLPPVAETPTPTTTPEETGPPVNERGNIVKGIGEEAGLTSMDGTPILTFAIDAITPNPECNAEYGAEAPENGTFVAVQMRVATAPVPPEELGYFAVSAYDFRYIGPDGVTRTDLGTFPAFTCMEGPGVFPTDQLHPGQQYQGVIVLDVSAPTGTLIYRPSSMDPSEGGWEWSF